MANINWADLFPNRSSVLVFVGYMALFVSQGLLVTGSQDTSNQYQYNTVSVVLFTEMFKLIISIILYCKEHTVLTMITGVVQNTKLLILYMIPSSLYCFYNNLSFVNLSQFDPTTYYLMLQFRVVITGVLFQVIFKKYLSQKQWISLCILTIGCMFKQIHIGSLPDDKEQGNLDESQKKNMDGFSLSLNGLFILIQIICSCLAGVYNEYLLKGEGFKVNIFLQNILMYLDSIVCNLIFLVVQGSLMDAFNISNLKSVFHFNVLLIIVNNTAIGIVTSFFLKYMNSILKTFASALELIFTALLARLLFAIPIYLNTIISIAIVSFAVFYYAHNPVVNLASDVQNSSNKALKENASTDKLLNSNKLPNINV